MYYHHTLTFRRHGHDQDNVHSADEGGPDEAHRLQDVQLNPASEQQ